jgi:hypothetical protein
MGAYLTWDNGNSALYFDLTVEEKLESTLQITDHPVEDGPDISDNAKMELDKFSLRIFVSNAPLSDPNGWYGGTTQQQFTVPAPPALGIGALEQVVEASLTQGQPGIQVQMLQWNAPIDAVQATLDRLTWLQTSKTLMQVVTSKRRYNNALLMKVSFSRTSQDGSGGSFQLEFKQIRLVQLAFTASPLPAQPRGNPPVSKGKKPPTPDPPKRSVAIAGGQFMGIISKTPGDP